VTKQTKKNEKKWRRIGLGSLEHLPSGSWRASVYINGRQERKAYPTKVMVERWLREMRMQKVEEESGAIERVVQNDRVTYGELAPSLLEWIRSGPERMHTQRTVESYEHQIKHVLKKWKNRPMARTTTRDIETWKVKLRRQGKSTSTIRHRLDALSKFHQYAVTMGHLSRVPCTIKRPALVRRSERDTVSENEMASLVEAAGALDDPRVAAIILLAGDAGLRASEICRLRWTDVRGSYLHVAVRDETDRTKSARGRDVPILTRRLEGALAAVPGPDDGPVILGCTTRWSVRRLASQAWSAALGGPAQVHRLRHRFASRCANLGVPAFKLMRWMGHATLQVTQAYYHDDLHVDEQIGPGLEQATHMPRRGRNGSRQVRQVTAKKGVKGSSSIGRAPVSKTGGCRFDSCLPCQTACLILARSRSQVSRP